LGAIIAEYIYHRFPHEAEGFLSKIKSKVVNRKTLSEIAETMELRKIIRYHHHRSINLSTLEGNALEAILGAIYLDGGYIAVKNSIHKHIFEKYADLNRILEEEIDFKSQLFIWSQKNKFKLEFEVISEENYSGFRNYSIQAKINGRVHGTGSGSSKKIAEQAASKQALEWIKEI
jgi:ribonuclease-3